jgi:DNA-binding beta-propeller fold protein YncE
MRSFLLLSSLLVLATPALASGPPLLLGYWGGLGSGPGQFNHPGDVAVAPDGNVYVVDRGNDRVQYFTSSGSYLGEWGSTGTAPGQFDIPHSIAIGQDGSIYVPDAANRVQKFTASGSYVMSFTDSLNQPQGVAVDGDGNLYVANAGWRYHIAKFDASGGLTKNFMKLTTGYSLAEQDGFLFVSESAVERFTTDGDFVDNTPTDATGETHATGVAVDAAGHLFEAQGGLSPPDEILVWSYDLQCRDRWLPPEPPPKHPAWLTPQTDGLAATTDGILYLTDYANNLILKVQYSAPVPTQQVTWGKVKASYR